ncbi:TetR/AcrR family transcriptional regulator [Nocardia sp. NPDC004722]
MTDDRSARQLAVAGADLLAQYPRRVLERGLRVEEAVLRAGVSHATFYRRFGTKPKFLAAVTASLIDEPTPEPELVRAAVREALHTAGGDRRQAIRALAEHHFERTRDGRSATRLMLAIVLGAADTGTARETRRAYARRERSVLEAVEELSGTGAVLFRKPFTAAKFTAAATAVIDGFGIRRCADLDSVSARLLADTLLALVNAAVDTGEQHEHIDDVLIGFDNVPRQPERPVRDPRSALLDAARTEFAERGYFQTNLSAIAARADIPVAVTHRLFPTKAHLIVGGLRPGFVGLAQSIEDEQLIGVPETDILANHLTRCATLVATESAFMDALIMVVTRDTVAEPAGTMSIREELNFPQLLVPILEQGRRNGIFVDSPSPFDTAATITNTLFLRCFTHRRESPEENAAVVGRILVSGLRAR